MKTISLSSIIAIIFLSSNSLSQITVNNALTPAQLVQTIFVGPGVVVSNVTYNGSAAAANVPQGNVSLFNSGGGFTYGSGLLLTTGLGAAAIGPNTAAGSSLPGTPNVGGDPDLGAIAAAGVTNGCILEFDFLSTDNVVQMNYMFGSEEYPEYAPSAYNDAFGFFLSGPGIAGPYSLGAVNIATIPGTNTPVTINNVNATTNAAFYLNNLGGASHGNEIQYDATTVGFTALRNIECNAVYHIKLAIANVGDQGWDSGVFFQAGSFLTQSPNTIDINFSDGGIAYEDCAPTSLNFSRLAANSVNPVTINFDVLGTALANDYSPLPLSVTFAAGQTNISIPIIPTVDNATEGTETLIIEYSYINSCGDPVIDRDTLYINDGPIVDAGPDISYCIGDSAQLNGMASGGTIAWSSPSMTGELTILNPFIYANPGGIYTLTVTNPIGCVKTDDVLVTALEQPDVNFDVVNNCFGFQTPFTDQTTLNPGATISTWEWRFGDGGISGNQSPVYSYASAGNFNVQLVVTTNSGCMDSLTLPLTIYPKPIADFTVQSVCDGLSSEFQNQSTVQLPDVITNWEWIFGDAATSNNENPIHLYTSENVYSNQLIVITNNGCRDTVILDNTVWPLPQINFLFNDTCLQNTTNFINTSEISNANSPNTIDSWVWTFADGASSTSENVVHEYANAGSYLVNLQGTSLHNCVSNLEQLVTVHPKPDAQYTVDAVCVNLANAFTDLSNANGGVIASWEWTFGDVTTSSNQNPTHIYATENVYGSQLIVTTADGCKDTAAAFATVYPRPIVDFTATNVCKDFSNQFAENTTISNLHTINNIAIWNYNFGDGASSNLPNVSHLYSNDGVYNVWLVATSNNNCADSIQKTVTVYPKPNGSLSGIDLSGCSPICPMITSTSTINAPGVIANFNWVYTDSFNDNGLYSSRCFENVTDATQNYGITLYLESDKGCLDTVITPVDYISVYHLPIADFTFNPAQPDLVHNIVEFENLSSYATSYQWQIGSFFNSVLVNPTAEMPYEPAAYVVQLIATTQNNCSDTMVKPITVKDVVIIHVPNTFTPNGDGTNFTFKPVIGAGVDIFNYGFYIYNRWGEMVFESHDADFGWNGDYAKKQSQSGTYTWEIVFKASTTGERKRMTGHVNLIK